MIMEIFTSLSKALTLSPAAALSASFSWGILSMLLSPCHLASIPLIIGFISGQGNIRANRALALSAVFASGIFAAIALIGVITAAAGKVLGDTGRYGNYIVAAVFLIVGLNLLDLIPLHFPGQQKLGIKQKGLLGALLLGLIFGVALGPCTFAFMAPVLALALKTASTNLLYAAGLLLAYGVGHCMVLVLAGTFSGAVQRYLDWNEKSKGALLVKKICGVLVILGGLFLALQ